MWPFKKKICKTCKWFKKTSTSKDHDGKDVVQGICSRFPQTVKKFDFNRCGEHE